MGLFGFGKEKKAKAEAAVRDALIRHPSIQILMENIISPPENHQWLNTVGGYYDFGFRIHVRCDWQCFAGSAVCGTGCVCPAAQDRRGRGRYQVQKAGLRP